MLHLVLHLYFSIKLYIYTVNNLKEAQGYMQKGAAGVCSDYLQDTDFE